MMIRITLNQDFRKNLGDGKQVVEFRDESGFVVGHYVPAHSDDVYAELLIDEAEIRRREAAGGGRSLRDIIADLESKS